MSKGRIPMLGAKNNPPRVYRPQKVVAELQKETRPALRAGAIVTDVTTLMRDTLADYMGERATEVFLVLYLSVRNQVVGFTEYGSGGISGVEVNTSGIMRDALLAGCAGIITVHNHPTGDATPSDDDRRLWQRIHSAGEIIGVPVVDNLIVGENEYFSELGEKTDGLGRVKFTRGQQ